LPEKWLEIGLVWDILLNPPQWNPNLQIHTVKKQMRLDVQNQIKLVQADGEVIGRTPVNIRLVPRGIRLVVPEEEDK
jgi:diacylglycerol kinase family enzyme